MTTVMLTEPSVALTVSARHVTARRTRRGKAHAPQFREVVSVTPASIIQADHAGAAMSEVVSEAGRPNIAVRRSPWWQATQRGRLPGRQLLHGQRATSSYRRAGARARWTRATGRWPQSLLDVARISGLGAKPVAAPCASCNRGGHPSPKSVAGKAWSSLNGPDGFALRRRRFMRGFGPGSTCGGRTRWNASA